MVLRHRAGRLKQWLNLLRRRFPEAQRVYDAVRCINEPVLVERLLVSLRSTPADHFHQASSPPISVSETTW